MGEAVKVEEFTDEDAFGIQPDFSPIEKAFTEIANDLHERSEKALEKGVSESLTRVEGIAKEIGDQNAKVVDQVQQAMKKIASESNNDAVREMQKVVTEALGQIKMPDLSSIGKEMARAVREMEQANAKAFARLCDTLSSMSESIAAAREVHVDMPAPPPPEKPRRWSFDVHRDADGNIKTITANASDEPRSALEAATRAVKEA